MPTDDIEVVLTPLKVTDPGTQVMRIERVPASQLYRANIHHVAGGQHQGIIVQKAAPGNPSSTDPDSERMFIAYLADHNNGSQDYTQEKRVLKFWFDKVSRLNQGQYEAVSDTFFKELTNPHSLPRDYVHFVKRVLCMVKKYPVIHKVELIMVQLSTAKGIPGNDDIYMNTTGIYISTPRQSQDDFRQQIHGHNIYSNCGGEIVYQNHDAILQHGDGIYMNTPGQSQDDFRQQMDANNIYSNCLGEFVSQNTSAKKEDMIMKRKPAITRRGWDAIWAIKKQKLIQILEDAYPSVLSMEDLIKHSNMRAGDVQYLMEDLKQRGSVKDVGRNQFIRIPDSQKLVFQTGTMQKRNTTLKRGKSVSDDVTDEAKKKVHEFKIVAHVPHLPAKDQPTIAIVTLLFCEKVAVDAMMDFKTTYIRVTKGEGEGQVYTLGKIGPHIVVSTKLSRIGHGEGAMMSAGNFGTRLLGTFQNIQHIILVGVGGAVASYDNTSIQLGDVVASHVETSNDPIYIHCRKVKTEDGKTTFVKDSWNPQDLGLMRNISSFKQQMASESNTWQRCIDDGVEELAGSETKFTKPAAHSDKPQLHLGLIGSGKKIASDESIKQKFATSTGCVCIDSGFQAVMQSIEGNRKESFAVIRGISDYQDGMCSREWQPYASLVAAAFMKAVILQISVGTEDEDDDD